MADFESWIEGAPSVQNILSDQLSDSEDILKGYSTHVGRI